MPLPKRNPKLPDLEEMSQGEINIRETERWKKLYMRLIESKKAMRGLAKDKEEAYCQMIDKLYGEPPVEQSNIMGGVHSFMNPNFKYTNDDEDPETQRLIAEARAKRIERETAEGLR